MNPTDLLYTNAFVNNNDNINYNRNLMTKDRINVLKTIDQPFPKSYNRNQEPILNEAVRDIFKDRYKKYKTTDLLIDSRDRNYELYPLPNKYTVSLSKQFTYIESITLLSIDFGNLFLTKTKISWSIISPDSALFTANIPSGMYTPQQLESILSNTMSSIPDESGNIQNISVKISASTNDIKIINRINNPQVIAFQTIITPADDIFGTIVAPVNNGIYILCKYQFTSFNLPIIPTDFPESIGGFSGTQFNYKEFWNGNPAVNEYKFIDTIIIGGITYYRYLLIPRKIYGEEITTTTAENIISAKTISQYLISIGKYDFNDVCSCIQCSYPRIGEAQDFFINFDKSPILEIFGWYECNENVLKFVQTNNSEDNISKIKCFNVYRETNGEYIFRTYPYILLKLSSFSYPADTIANNLVKTQNISSPTNDIKNISNLFAKIDINAATEKVIGNNPNLSNPLKFYETPLEKLNELTITFVDRNGIPIDLKCDQTIVLRIVEAVDVLKDTLIDSRHGEATTTGVRGGF